MKRLTKKYFRKTANGGFSIWCPGCHTGHFFDKRWTLDEATKTVKPSMNVNNEECHFNITNGEIIYHSCRHNLSGKTVCMVPF
ncbi:MAG TPA: hypothetical protein VIK55_06765 [Paludibacter sp.]